MNEHARSVIKKMLFRMMQKLAHGLLRCQDGIFGRDEVP